MQILAWIAPFLVYLGGGAIVRSIYLSYNPITMSTDFEHLQHMEYFIYDLIALIYNLIVADEIKIRNIDQKEYVAVLVWAPAIVFVAVVFFLPDSNGVMWLNTVVCLLSMLILGVWRVNQD